MKLYQVIAQNHLIAKGISPIQIYKKEMREYLENFSVEKSRAALEEIVKLYSTQADEPTKADINAALAIAEKHFLDIPPSLSYNLMKHTEAAWNYSRNPLKPVQKAEPDEPTQPELIPAEQPLIMNIDPDVIAKLTQANIVWIQGHAAGSELMKQLSSTLAELKLQGLTMWEIAEELQQRFLDLTPTGYAKVFGERDYWKIVTQNQTTRITSYAAIDDYELAGYDGYEWITREEGYCETCEKLGKAPYRYFRVADARKNINDYYKAAEMTDLKKALKAMKAASPFLKDDDDVLEGVMPQVHIRCFCEIRPVMISSIPEFERELYLYIAA
jgi:hypothetical protein